MKFNLLGEQFSSLIAKGRDIFFRISLFLPGRLQFLLAKGNSLKEGTLGAHDS